MPFRSVQGYLTSRNHLTNWDATGMNTGGSWGMQIVNTGGSWGMQIAGVHSCKILFGPASNRQGKKQNDR